MNDPLPAGPILARPPQGAIPRRMRRWRPAVVLGAGASFVAAAALVGPAAFGAAPVWATLAAMALYLTAHLLRAARLAIVASALLGVSARTTGLLHFATAPFVMLVPLKLGEGVRLHQLWVAGRRAPGAVIALLIDRTLDAVMLLALLISLSLSGQSLDGGAATVLWLTGAAAAAAGVAFVIGPRACASLQRYVVVHHRRRTSLRGLPFIDTLRRSLTEGAALLRKQGAALLVISVLIWGMELAAAALFATWALTPELRDAGVLLVTRTTQEWRAATGAGVDPALAASAAASLLVLLAVWPVALYVYISRLDAEPLRRTRASDLPEGADGP